jgi:hypothetical protein
MAPCQRRTRSSWKRWAFGQGVKQSGFGREECLEEMLRFTQEKNIRVKAEAYARLAATIVVAECL